MNTILLRLAGPMQSWGTQSRFSERETGLEPSKSGVIGLLCAALGRRRQESVADLAALRMGVRVDREGTMLVDYQTAGGKHRRGDNYGVRKASGARGDTVVSRRYYLADADFLVGLEGRDVELLRDVQRALCSPFWQIYLGRKAFPPARPVAERDGLCEGIALEEALRRSPWRQPHRNAGSAGESVKLRLVLESTADEGEEVRSDQPVGAAYADRRFVLRHVRTAFLTVGKEVAVLEN